MYLNFHNRKNTGNKYKKQFCFASFTKHPAQINRCEMLKYQE